MAVLVHLQVGPYSKTPEALKILRTGTGLQARMKARLVDWAVEWKTIRACIKAALDELPRAGLRLMQAGFFVLS